MTRATDAVAEDFFVLRTPLLAFDVLAGLSARLQAPSASVDELAAALADDRRAVAGRLRGLLARPEARDAVWLASPDLFAELEPWLDGGPEPPPKALRAGLRYAARMCARPTPFGLFAGSSLGRLAPRTRLALAGTDRRTTSLDPQLLTEVAERLEVDGEVRAHLHFRPNSSLYRAAGRWRYAEAATSGRGRRHRLVAVDGGTALELVLRRAAGGARLAELAEALSAAGPEPAAAVAFVAELVDAQVLVSDLAPPVTGSEPGTALLARLAGVPSAAPATRALESAQAMLRDVDASGPGADLRRYEAVARRLDGLKTKLRPARSVIADLLRPLARDELGRDVAAEIARSAEVLAGLTARRAGDPLSAWREAFTARYESREVPLAEALDDESGIGFEPSASPAADGSPLLAGLPWAAKDAREMTWGPRAPLLLRRLTRALQAGERELQLGEADVDELRAADPAELPDAFAALATLAAPSRAALADGDFRVRLHGVSGPSGARLLGRASLADAELAAAVRRHLRREEALQPGAVFAEIVHLPEGRTGKLIARPRLREHEIAYLGRPGASDDAVLEVADLTVAVRGERIVLRSERLGREVVPRLTSAQNYSLRALPLYRFLCTLQGQGRAAGLVWSWGALESAPFLPRVTSGRTVFARASWNLGQDELREVLAPGGEPARFEAVQALRARRGLPRWVALADADNELVVDLDNVLAVETLLGLVARRSEFRLVELWPAPESLCVSGPGGHHASELVVPFVRRREPAPAAPVRVRPPAREAIRRTFPPGSEWLSAKLYAGTATADTLLGELVAPVVAGALASGAADGWFFIRYGDPDWHLRVRLHGDPGRLVGEVVPALHAAAERELESGRLRRLALDTYEREIERYGGAAALEACEEIFRADSAAVLTLLPGVVGDAGAAVRWRLAIVGVDRLLDDILADAAVKRTLVRQLRDGYAAEHGAGGALKGAIGARFREERSELEALLASRAADAGQLPAMRTFAERSVRVAPAAARLRELAAEGRLTESLGEVAGSLAHMHVNRLLRSAHRAHELVLHDLLARLHAGQEARARAAAALARGGP